MSFRGESGPGEDRKHQRKSHPSTWPWWPHSTRAKKDTSSITVSGRSCPLAAALADGPWAWGSPGRRHHWEGQDSSYKDSGLCFPVLPGQLTGGIFFILGGPVGSRQFLTCGMSVCELGGGVLIDISFCSLLTSLSFGLDDSLWWGLCICPGGF